MGATSLFTAALACVSRLGEVVAEAHYCRPAARYRLQEAERLQRVLKHPLYKLDPIKAITSHLSQVLPPVPPAGTAQQPGQGKPKPNKPKQPHQPDRSLHGGVRGVASGKAGQGGSTGLRR